MIENINNLLCRKLDKKEFSPFHVAEVGVWHPHTSNIYQYIKGGVKTTLVEPDPDSISLIKSKFSNKNNVTLYEVAIFDSNGEVELYKRESSTFVSSLSASPALINDDCDIQNVEKFTAKAILFSEIDDGTIDLISIATEGSEWFVIKNMISRPTVISLETHGGMYVNPYLKELIEWLRKNNYVLWYKDKSDSVFVLRDTIPVTVIDKIIIFKSNLLIAFKSKKKRLSKIVKKFFKKNV